MNSTKADLLFVCVLITGFQCVLENPGKFWNYSLKLPGLGKVLENEFDPANYSLRSWKVLEFTCGLT